MKLGSGLGVILGLVLGGWVLSSYGFARVAAVLDHASGLGLCAVILFHFCQLAFSAAAWRKIAGPTTPQPSIGQFIMLRWIREGVNNLLPVAQIGGEFVAARLLQRRGLSLGTAIAGSVADLTMEMVTQIAFTLLGLGLLLLLVGGGGIVRTAVAGLAVATATAVAFVAAQWLGVARLLERVLVWLSRVIGWDGLGNVEGVHAALIGIYRAPRRLVGAACCHSMSWLLGGVEVWLALRVLGQDVPLSAALVIESLGQALKAAGFALPGALGVQEGGYIIVCGLFGVSPPLAIALSLVKRLREVVFGVPGLVVWRRLAVAPAVGRGWRALQGALR